MKKRKLLFKKIFIISFLFIPCLCLAAENPRETPVVRVVKENADSVVNISTERVVLLRENPYWRRYGSELDLFFGDFFRFPSRTRTFKLNSVGSGVIIDEKGLIVTNAHVVHRATNIFVILNDGSSVEGAVVYENLKDDLAIIKIVPPRKLQKIKMAQDDDVIIGETVVAIGNPLGLENSVSVGVVSGKDRTLYSSGGQVISEGLLQTDAPINPGNSGGALLNLNGELAGINVAVVQHSQNIGFAIPIRKVREAIEAHERNVQVVLKEKHVDSQEDFDVKPAMPAAPKEPVDLWDPFEEMNRMQQHMGKMFQDIFNFDRSFPFGGALESQIAYGTDFNIKEEDDRYLIYLDLKGVDAERLNIEVNPRSITVSGRTTTFTEQTDAHTRYQARSSGSFLRAIPLPADADSEKVRTEKNEDQLIIILPKRR